jgi:hypothetical protein
MPRHDIAQEASRGGLARARLYPRRWQELLMQFIRDRKDGRTQCQTFQAWLRTKGLRALAFGGNGDARRHRRSSRAAAPARRRA